MIELTVGYVSGFIALVVFAVQLWSPNTIAFILAGILKDNNTAATWSVAGRALQNTYWPDLLRVDTSRLRGVRIDVIVLTKLIPAVALLVAITGTVTPLGLHEQLVPAKKVSVPFSYIRDSSPWGLGTPLRTTLPFTRKCDTGGTAFNTMPRACPFSNTIVITSGNYGNLTAALPYGYNTSLPRVLEETFSSGSRPDTTVSNIFDIQWRQWTTRKSPFINNGSVVAIGAYRPMQNLLLNNATEVVEGLVVDTVHGGIGFRNHTAPLGFKYGATWEEDLLFVEPETSCVNTNITLDFIVNQEDTSDILFMHSLALTDRGGFVNMNKTYPYYDRSSTQENPDLQGRAYKAAWLNNAWSMAYMNVTNVANSTYGKKAFSYLDSYVGKKFPLKVPTSGGGLGQKNYQIPRVTTTWGEMFDLYDFDGNSTFLNPFKINNTDFNSIQTICSGAGNDDVANITNIFGTCGLVYGSPRRSDGADKDRILPFEGGTEWTLPVYTCASVVKATIKTVKFNINETKGDDLKALSVESIFDKKYNEPSEVPLWGVEDTGDLYRHISPLWGLISPDYEHKDNISSLRKESLYLPGGTDNSMPFGYRPVSYQNMPGTDFYRPAMFTAYGGLVQAASADYTGYANMALGARWVNLSASADTVGEMLNLIFTDVVAGAVVGTKGLLEPGNTSPGNRVDIQVQPLVRRIRYHWPFAIPAFILAAIVVLVTFVALLSFIFRFATVATMRQQLYQTSVGRIFTSFMHPEYCDLKMTSIEWSRKFGREVVDLRGDVAPVTKIALSSEQKQDQTVFPPLLPYEGT